ncbi:MAG: signal peptide peptidase SppA [Deltaproteobacteria bacterium]|nr:signal peptide peptidase SppA [Deltaproteobacteria bacterium]
MKKVFFIVFAITFFITGCVSINIPKVGPLTEYVVGGKGTDKVLIMDISGMIWDKEEKDFMGLKTMPRLTARIKEELDKASEDRKVKAVVLRINSPGGTVTTCDIINHEIKNFKKKTGKVVVAELMDVAASGGYYIAAASDRIAAHPTTITGSIGVVAYMINASGLLEKIGITNETIKSGDKKDIGSPLRPMTPEEREILKGVINSLYGRFLDAVAEGRKEISKEELKKIADGRVYTAEQALSLKLIDRIGYLDDAIEIAKSEAGIKEAAIITYARPGSYRSNVYSAWDMPNTINLVNIDAGSFMDFLGVRFMYLWTP